MDNKPNKTINYIAAIDMNSDTPVYLDGNIAKIPISNEELEYKLVLAKSKTNNKGIHKDEIIDIEYISEEEQYNYKMFYAGMIQGYEMGYEYRDDSETTRLQDENNKQKNIIKQYEELIDLYEKQMQDQNKYIKSLESKKKWWMFWIRIKTIK